MQNSTEACTRRVLQALHAARKPGWMFPAHFLDIFFEQPVADGAAVGLMHIGPHCLDSAGRVGKAALALLADVSMAAAVRSHEGRSVRIATLSMRLSFGVRPAAGRLRAVARVRMLPPGLAMTAAVTQVEILDDAGNICCSGEASFAALENRQQTPDHPLPTSSTLTGCLHPDELDAPERAVWERACAHAAHSKGAPGFLDRFWSLPVPAPDDGAASAWSARLGQHNSNRVGHLQGGVLMGLLAGACIAATEGQYQLVDIAVQYLEGASDENVALQAAPGRLGGKAAFMHASALGADGRVRASAQASLIRTRS